MKKLITLAAAMVLAVGAYAQGQVNFSNYVPSAGINAPVFAADGSTKLAGSQFMAQLYAGTSASSLAAVGSPVPFRTGAGAGYFSGGAVAVPGIAGGASAMVEVRAWDSNTGATYETAKIIGSSTPPLSITLGGAGNPPSLPANLTGLSSFNISPVPEPSTIALGILGMAGLLLRRRK